MKTRSVLVELAAVALTTIFTVPAMATPLTFSFTGTVDHNDNGGPTGQAASGSVTFDPATFYMGNSDGLTYSQSYGQYFTPTSCSLCVQQTSPPQAHGSATTGTSSYTTGGGSNFVLGYMDVYRNYGAGGYNRVYAQVFSVDLDSNAREIAIWVEDSLGAASKLFNDVGGGLAFDQAVNWLAAGATSRFELYDLQGGHYEAGVLTSVTRSSSGVPEPATLALMGIALAGLASARRRKQ